MDKLRIYICLLVILIVGFPVLTFPQAPAQLFQQGLLKENGEGDLKTAVAIYEKIVGDATAERSLRAKALLHIGMCWEKLGKDEAQKAYQRVIQEFADRHEMVAEARTRLAALEHPDTTTDPSGVVVRQVWAPALDDLGAVSPDGRYLSFVDWETGDIAVRDLTTGDNRRLTNKGSWQENPDEYAWFSTISPDAKQVAYTWADYASKGAFHDLRVISVTGGGDGSKPRIVYRNDEVEWVQPSDWSPDGKHVLALFTRKDRTNQIGLVSMADGSVRVLKTLDWRYPGNARFSPDGRYIVYDFPPKEDSLERDIFVLATDGSREILLVEHSGDDTVLGWAPDGERILFASDRTGSWDAWVIQVPDGRLLGPPELVKEDIGRIVPMGFTRNGSFYYGVARGTSDVYVATLDPATGKLLAPPKKISQRFVGGNKGPDWSPDGQYLAYVSERGTFPGLSSSWVLVIRSVETGKERELPLKMTNFMALQPRWSPDGRFLLAAGKDHKGREGLYRINAQTGEVTPIVPGASTKSGAWHPDGKTIFYPLYDPTSDFWRILVRDLEAGQEKEVHQLSREVVPTGNAYFRKFVLSRDGRQLAFCRSNVLKVMPATGGEPLELLRLQPQQLQEGIQIMSLAWMPDGRHLLFTKGRYPKLEMWRISAEGGEPQKLGLAMDSLGLFGLSVHPDGRRVAFHATIGDKFTAEVWVMENFLPELKAAN